MNVFWDDEEWNHHMWSEGMKKEFQMVKIISERMMFEEKEQRIPEWEQEKNPT